MWIVICKTAQSLGPSAVLIDFFCQTIFTQSGEYKSVTGNFS